MASPTAIAAYLALFTFIGFAFLFVNLLIGRIVRPDDPHTEKKEIYECGEPAIGSSFVQFDIRFYVVALVFIVFDAEVAFLFPAATVFGKQTQLADLVQAAPLTTEETALAEGAKGLFQEMQVASPPNGLKSAGLSDDVRKFTWYVYAATLFFFLVLFVGFAYEWKTGAFDWVRAVTSERAPPAMPSKTAVDASEAVLTG